MAAGDSVTATSLRLRGWLDGMPALRQQQPGSGGRACPAGLRRRGGARDPGVEPRVLLVPPARGGDSRRGQGWQACRRHDADEAPCGRRPLLGAVFHAHRRPRPDVDPSRRDSGTGMEKAVRRHHGRRHRHHPRLARHERQTAGHRGQDSVHRRGRLRLARKQCPGPTKRRMRPTTRWPIAGPAGGNWTCRRRMGSSFASAAAARSGW